MIKYYCDVCGKTSEHFGECGFLEDYLDIEIICDACQEQITELVAALRANSKSQKISHLCNSDEHNG
jgi:predicted RNA-binding protein associated with RNAse of E/G family